MDSLIRTRNILSKTGLSRAGRSRIGLSLAVLLGIGTAASLLAPHAKADTWDKMTLLTFSEPVQVMNTYLEPGTYMFRILDTDRHIIAITNKDRSKPYGIVFAVAAYRVFPADKAQVTFWETPPGTVKAVRYWWYPGDTNGQEFTYPTNLREVAAVTPPPPPAPAPAPQVAEAGPPQPVAPPAPQVQQPQPEPQPPVEIAQNNPPPAPAQPEQPPQQELPKTASPYPMIGLVGLLSLGSYLSLRLKSSR